MSPFFIKSAFNLNDWINDSKKEICFLGRSNVGKSSTINSLANCKIAFTSKTPGRTQLVNFFDFGLYRVVDLPGYGYAKISKTKKEEINNLLFEYLSKRENLIVIFQICDINVITNQDIDVSNFLKNKFQNHFIILNKIDKLNKSFFDNNKNKISKLLDIDVNKLIPISSKKKININILSNLINFIINKE